MIGRCSRAPDPEGATGAQGGRRRHRAGLRTALELADQQALTLARSGAELEGVLAGLAERRAAVEAQSAGADAAIAREQARRDAASAAIAAAESRAEEHARERERAVAALVAAENDARAIRARMTDERRLADDAARDLTALQARLELLDRTHASGEGLYAGVRAVEDRIVIVVEAGFAVVRQPIHELAVRDVQRGAGRGGAATLLATDVLELGHVPIHDGDGDFSHLIRPLRRFAVCSAISD